MKLGFAMAFRTLFVKSTFTAICMVSLASCGDLNREILRGEVHVSADDNKSLEGAEVKLYYLQDEKYFQKNGEWYYTEIKKIDSQHKVSFDGFGYQIQVLALVDGYWEGIQEQFPVYKNIPGKAASPEPTVIKMNLRRKIHPRSLYVKHEKLRMSLLNVKYGYDLTRGDLVKPHGTGTVADLYFSVDGQMDENPELFDVSITIRFPNPGDGIIPVQREDGGKSKLFLGQVAPLDGYQPELKLHVTRKIGEPFGKRKGEPTTYTSIAGMEDVLLDGFWFRTNTVLDSKTGEVLKARYGKLGVEYGNGISYYYKRSVKEGESHAGVTFFYFYSPDDSRSLEFNGNNLMPKPKNAIMNYYPQELY